MTIQWIFLIPILAVVYCRPQINPQESSSIEIEKQEVVEIKPKIETAFEDLSKNDETQRDLEENTRQILAKIALVNEKQGLTKKKSKPYHHFPFGYYRSQQENNNRKRTDSDFKFSRDPFTNPILDYIERQNSDTESNKRIFVKEGFTKENDEVPPGHYIKRKIVHQQMHQLMPYPGYNFVNMPVMPAQEMNIFPPLQTPNYTNKKKSELEKQTIDNIKNIVENSQNNPTSNYNPLFYSYFPQLSYPYQFPQPDVYNMYKPNSPENLYRPAKQWQWPLGQYFPIIIKDPFLHMMNAMTTMVEFGSSGNTQQDSCAKQDNSEIINKNEDNIVETKSRSFPKKSQLNYNIVDNDNGSEVIITNEDNSNSRTTLDIEDLEITDDRKNSLSLDLNIRQSKQNHEITKNVSYNSTKSAPYLISVVPSVETVHITKTTVDGDKSSRQSPPIRDQILHEDELNDEEFEKAEEVQVAQNGHKKLFSKDNTGSGIFVHKIKVRKGGVAIAGPGGIATAGSGGTAIVGPNGFAYTHPDSLAIAGSGTKVVAVEPTISLAQVIADHNKNKSRGDGHLPSRVGKIVAVGPVIYYNKG